MCVYIHQDITFSDINLLKYCKEQDLEIATVKIKFNKKNIIVACLYRAPTGEFVYFLNQLDSGFGGLEVACWPLGPKFAGSNPSDFSRRKNPRHAFLRNGSKAVCPMSHICRM